MVMMTIMQRKKEKGRDVHSVQYVCVSVCFVLYFGSGLYKIRRNELEEGGEVTCALVLADVTTCKSLVRRPEINEMDEGGN